MVQADSVFDETPSVSSAWRSLGSADRWMRVSEVLGTFLDGTAATLVRMPAPHALEVRVTLKQPPRLEGAMLFSLEDKVRQYVGEPLEVWCEPVRDANKPRQRMEVIRDWVERRGVLKRQSEGTPMVAGTDLYNAGDKPWE